MISKTGKVPLSRLLCNARGLGLIEILLCVVLLSTGLVAVYRPLLKSLGILYDTESRILANRLSHNQIWKIQEEMRRKGELPEIPAREIVTYRDKAFEFSAGATPLDKDKTLYRLETRTSWQYGSRKRSLYRTVYAATF